MFTPRAQLIPRARRWLLALPILAAIASPLRAQSVRSLLDGYVTEAMRSNLTVARRAAAERGANAAVREANGRFLPSVGANARYSQFSGTTDIGDFINPAYGALNQLIGEARFPTNISATLPLKQETKLELVQPLFNDALFGARAVARAQRDLAGASKRAAMRQLAADVQLAWLGYGSATSVIATLNATMPVVEENVRVSEKLVSAGQATPDVVLRARAERSELEQQIADAEQVRNAARRSFNILRNQDNESSITLADDRSLDSTFEGALQLIDAQSRAALEANARAQREELQQANNAIQIAQGQSRIASSALLPTFALSASYGVQGERYRFDKNNDVAIASLVFSWNVFNGGQDAARREQAAYARDEARDASREAERAVMVDVGNAYDALVAARTGLRTATDRLESARRAFTLVERRYSEGLATQIEFLSARAAFTSAAINQVLTRYTLLGRAVNLERAAALRAIPQ